MDLPKTASDALIYQVQADLAYDDTEDFKSCKSLLRTYLDKVNFFRNEKIQKLQDKIDADGQEAKLEKHISFLQTIKALQGLQKWVGVLLSDAKSSTEQKDRQNERIIKILRDLDEENSTTLNRTQQNLSVESFQTGENGLAQALKAGIGIKYSAEQQRNFQRLLGNLNIENALDRQQGAAQGQLDALKKAKLFGKFFNIFQIFTSSILSTFVLGPGGALTQVLSKASRFFQIVVPQFTQAIYGSMMQGLYSLGVMPFQNKIKTAQKQSELSQLDYQNKVLQYANDENYAQKSRSRTDKILKNLEDGQ